MQFIRMGPRLIFIRSCQISKTKDILLDMFHAKEREFLLGIEEATENSSLLFITGLGHVKTAVEDAQSILLVDQPASVCLSAIINNKLTDLIERVDLGPSLMFMRIAGDEKDVVADIQKMYGGRILPIREAIREGGKDNTILFFTKKQLSAVLSIKDVLNTHLLLPYPSAEINKRLRSESILFITRHLEERRWFELRINIYDIYGRYKEHYERLIFVLTQLEVGMVLEERWTKDHALVLLSVLAYQIRLFTLYEPKEIKKILLGLEYDDRGKRWADFDLYHRNKKISWLDIDREKKRRNKIEEAILHRQRLLAELSPSAVEKLLEMEKTLNKRRK